MLVSTLNDLKQSIWPNDMSAILVNDCSSDVVTNSICDSFELSGVDTTIIKNPVNKGVAESLRIGFQYLWDKNVDVFCDLDSDVAVKPYWLNVLLYLQGMFSDCLITGFNTPAHKTTQIFDDYDFKKSLGGINIMFGRCLFPIVMESLKGTRWDWDLSYSIEKTTHRIVAPPL